MSLSTSTGRARCAGSIAIALVMGLGSAAPSSAAMMMNLGSTPVPLNAGVELDANSRYVWRAVTMSEKPVVQPSAWLSAPWATLKVWGNFDLSDNEDLKGLNRVDVQLEARQQAGPFAVKPAVMGYFYPSDAAPSTAELQLEMSYALPQGFGLFSRHSMDVSEYRSATFNAVGVSFGKEEAQRWSVATAAFVGLGSPQFAAAYIGPANETVRMAGAEASVTVPVANMFSVRPHVGYMQVLEGRVRDLMSEDAPVVLGLAINRGF